LWRHFRVNKDADMLSMYFTRSLARTATLLCVLPNREVASPHRHSTSWTAFV
jgi:hypothetical protein